VLDTPRIKVAAERRGHPDKALTAVHVRNIRKRGKYCDGNGLYLVVDPTGAERWIVRTVILALANLRPAEGEQSGGYRRLPASRIIISTSGACRRELRRLFKTYFNRLAPAGADCVAPPWRSR
jgi:hypothetical protein